MKLKKNKLFESLFRPEFRTKHYWCKLHTPVYVRTWEPCSDSPVDGVAFSLDFESRLKLDILRSKGRTCKYYSIQRFGRPLTMWSKNDTIVSYAQTYVSVYGTRVTSTDVDTPPPPRDPLYLLRASLVRNTNDGVQQNGCPATAAVTAGVFRVTIPRWYTNTSPFGRTVFARGCPENTIRLRVTLLSSERPFFPANVSGRSRVVLGTQKRKKSYTHVKYLYYHTAGGFCMGIIKLLSWWVIQWKCERS